MIEIIKRRGNKEEDDEGRGMENTVLYCTYMGVVLSYDNYLRVSIG